MSTKQKVSKIVKLKGVRLSFPSIFKPTAFDEGQTPKYSAQFLIPKEDKLQVNTVVAAIKEILNEANGGTKLAPEKYCFRDGSTKPELDGYGEDVHFVSASSQKRFGVFNNDNTPITEEDNVIYAGCYVDVALNLVWQNHPKYGKRVNAYIRTIRFRRDGEAFGAGPVDPTDEFAEFDDEENTPSSDVDSLV